MFAFLCEENDSYEITMNSYLARKVNVMEPSVASWHEYGCFSKSSALILRKVPYSLQPKSTLSFRLFFWFNNDSYAIS